jgi:diguanylate cyclase (GGDEF)-like protein
MENKTDILIVDDKPENLFVIESILSSPELNIVKASSGNEALGLMLDYNFALVLLDVQMPDMDGFETANLMRGSEMTRHIPIVFITANSKEQMYVFKGYEVGAVDYLFKPIEAQILRGKAQVFIDLHKQKEQLKAQTKMLEEKIKELTLLKETNTQLVNLSMIDGLTGIPNRRSFDNFMGIQFRRARRKPQVLSMIMIDIDHFKAYNDNYGHLYGDDCLIQVAKCLADGVKRPMDFVARFGGEEFAVVLPETSKEDAVKIAEGLRLRVQNMSILHGFTSTSKYVTISLGVSTMESSTMLSIDELVRSADKALYKAKHSGRNIVVVI